jgi:LmbE family N-acetylglucosaminyl deacetylase
MGNTGAAVAKPFDPAVPGTAEPSWENALVAARDWQPEPRPLLVVSPHPDDEVLGVGGLMRAHARAGFSVAVLSVTDGEAAYPDWEGLRRTRRDELAEALRVLGGGIESRHLGVPDGQVADYRDLLSEVVNHFSQDRPLLAAPYECDGHPDHDTVGAVCGDIARRRGLPLIRYLIWAWHHATPATLAHHRWGRFALDLPTRRAKAHAIQCFASQLRPRGRPPILPGHVLPYFARSYEAFLL